MTKKFIPFRPLSKSSGAKDKPLECPCGHAPQLLKQFFNRDQRLGEQLFFQIDHHASWCSSCQEALAQMTINAGEATAA